MEIKRDPYKAWQKVKDIPGGAMSKRERLRRAKEKRFRISDRRRRKANKNKARSSDKKGAHDGTRTHVGMSERLDLIT